MATKFGDLGDGSLGLRVSKPGFDVETEPLGSDNISFDSRLNDFGIIHAQGIWNWGDPIITFTPLPYVPLVSVARIDSENRIRYEDTIQVTIGTAIHWTTPWVAIVSESTLLIRKLDNPWYGFSVPTPSKFLYTVFAIETPE